MLRTNAGNGHTAPGNVRLRPDPKRLRLDGERLGGRVRSARRRHHGWYAIRCRDPARRIPRPHPARVASGEKLTVIASAYGTSRPSIRRALDRPEVARLLAKEQRRLASNADRQRRRDQEAMLSNVGFPSRAAARAARPELDRTRPTAAFGVNDTRPGGLGAVASTSSRDRGRRGGMRVLSEIMYALNNDRPGAPPPDWQSPRRRMGNAPPQGMQRVEDPRGGWSWVEVPS